MGVIRVGRLSPNQLVHIPNHGDYLLVVSKVSQWLLHSLARSMPGLVVWTWWTRGVVMVMKEDWPEEHSMRQPIGRKVL
jgi:hypothetical protein